MRTGGAVGAGIGDGGRIAEDEGEARNDDSTVGMPRC
jgi:hypothetical protein